MCPAARAGRCLILVQKCVARARRTLYPPSGGAAAPRLFDRITVADAPRRDQGVRPTRRKLVNRHDRGGAPAIVPGTHATEGARSDDSILRPDHRRYAHTARHRQSSGGLHQHRQDPLIMPDLERGSRSTAIRRNKRRTAGRRAVIYDSSTAPVTDLAAARIRRARSSAGLSTSTNGQHDGHRPRHNIAGQRLRQGIGNLQPGRHAACMSPAWPRSPARAVAAPPASSLLPRCADASAPAYDQLTRVRVRRRTFPSRRRQRRLRG